MNHLIALTAAILVFAAWSSPPVDAQNIDAILDKAEQALGGPAKLAEIQSVRIRSHGTWEMPSQAIPPTAFQAEVVFSRPDHVLVSWQFPQELGGDLAICYDGTDAWGTWAAPPARYKGWLREISLQMAAEMQLFLVAAARQQYGDTFTIESTDTNDTAPLVKVVCRPFAEAKPWSVWFDKRTSNLVKLEHDSYHMDGRPTLSRIARSMPKSFDGLVYPSHTKFEALRNGKPIEAAEETIDSIELNPQLPANFFAFPGWKGDPLAIGTKDVARETVVKFVHRGPYDEISAAIDRTMEVILSAGLIPVGAASGVYLNDPAAVAPADLRTEIVVRVAQLKEEKPTLPDGYVFTTQPAMQVAYAYHLGDYDSEGEAHQRLRAWMKSEGLLAAGPPRAIWFHDPKVMVADDLLTEIQVPFQPSQ